MTVYSTKQFLQFLCRRAMAMFKTIAKNVIALVLAPSTTVATQLLGSVFAALGSQVVPVTVARRASMVTL